MTTQTVSIYAEGPADLRALIEAREWLEAGVTNADVYLPDGKVHRYTKTDLPAIYRKITYSM